MKKNVQAGHRPRAATAARARRAARAAKADRRTRAVSSMAGRTAVVAAIGAGVLLSGGPVAYAAAPIGTVVDLGPSAARAA